MMGEPVLSAVRSWCSHILVGIKGFAATAAGEPTGGCTGQNLKRKSRLSTQWSVHTATESSRHTETKTENIAVMNTMSWTGLVRRR